jgi:hypothetical protein
MSLEDFELARLDRVANLRKQLRDIAEEWIEAEVEAQLAHWARESRWRSLELSTNNRQCGDSSRSRQPALPRNDKSSQADLSTKNTIRWPMPKSNLDSMTRKPPPPLRTLTRTRESVASARLAIVPSSHRQYDHRVEHLPSQCEEREVRPDAFAAVRYFRRGSHSR